MKRTRVLIVFSSGKIGGAERSLTRMARVSSIEEMDYRLATCGVGTEWCEWAQTEGLSAACYPVFGGLFINLWHLVRFIRECWRWRPDVVYVVGIRAAGLVRGLRMLFPRFAVVHGVRSTFPPGTRLAFRMKVSERLFARKTDHYIANSYAGAESLVNIARIPNEKVSVIRNGVAPSSVLPPCLRIRERSVAVVANLNQYKGHVEFFDVVELVKRAVPDVKFLFIGRDDSAGSVRRALHDRGLADTIALIGFVPCPDAIVATTRVFALPSTQIEGSPTAVIEALMLGIPVVAYAIGGLSEIVESGRTGILVPAGSKEAFAHALVRLLLEEEINERYSTAARADAAARFSLLECAAQHALVLQRFRAPTT